MSLSFNITINFDFIAPALFIASYAIPALIAYLFFGSRVDRLIIEIDALGQQIVDVIAADHFEPAATSKERKKAA